MLSYNASTKDKIMLEFIKNSIDFDFEDTGFLELPELGVTPKIALERFLISTESEETLDGTYA